MAVKGLSMAVKGLSMAVKIPGRLGEQVTHEMDTRRAEPAGAGLAAGLNTIGGDVFIWISLHAVQGAGVASRRARLC